VWFQNEVPPLIAPDVERRVEAIPWTDLAKDYAHN
jgi:hypothetical protein